MVVRVRIIGCGDAFGSGGRFNTCFMLEANSGKSLIDCGASSLIALKRQQIDPDDIRSIAITHLHGDHFGGLVFLLREATLFKSRTASLTIAGPPGLAKRLEAAMEVFFPRGWVVPSTFDLDIVEMEPNRQYELGSVSVIPFLVEHECGAPPFALRASVDGKTITYTGDTQWVETLIDAGRDADLFIAEAYFHEKPINKHLSYQTVRSRLQDVGARRVLLTHLHVDLLNRLNQVDLEIAEDGMVIDL